MSALNLGNRPAEPRRRDCPYCGHDLGVGPGHYVPPGFGSPGFAACEQLCDDCKTAKEVGQQSTGP